MGALMAGYLLSCAHPVMQEAANSTMPLPHGRQALRGEAGTSVPYTAVPAFLTLGLHNPHLYPAV